jgi:hypothetical protein
VSVEAFIKLYNFILISCRYEKKVSWEILGFCSRAVEASVLLQSCG